MDPSRNPSRRSFIGDLAVYAGQNPKRVNAYFILAGLASVEAEKSRRVSTQGKLF